MAQHAHDQDVLESLHGPSPADARESLVYWRRRLDVLPRHRRAARREARTMVLAWEDRLRLAEIERWGGGRMGRAAGAFVVLRTLRGRALAKLAFGLLIPKWLVIGVLTVVLGTALLVGAVFGALLTALL